MNVFQYVPNGFEYAAFVNAINIFVMTILWAGVFAERRNCLPIYILLEVISRHDSYRLISSQIPFVVFGFIGFMLNPGQDSGNHRGVEQFFMWMGIFILVCTIVYVMVIFDLIECVILFKVLIERYFYR